VEVSEPIQLILIDDNPTFLNVALHFLKRQADVDVLAAELRVSSALRLAEAHSPHLVVLDLDMPEMSGLEAIQRFHAIHPDLPVIVLSVLDSASDQQAARSAGAVCFVSKQSMHTDLMPAIRSFGPHSQLALAAGAVSFVN